MTCRQLGNDTTYDTEKKNPTSHDVADTSAVSGRRVGKTQRHIVKTNCRRHLKRRHFQLRSTTTATSHRRQRRQPPYLVPFPIPQRRYTAIIADTTMPIGRQSLHLRPPPSLPHLPMAHTKSCPGLLRQQQNSATTRNSVPVAVSVR